MICERRRLRLHGAIARVPHSFRYVVSSEGLGCLRRSRFSSVCSAEQD